MTTMDRNQIINIALFIPLIFIEVSSGTVTTKKIHRSSCHNEATFKSNGKDFKAKASSSKLISSTNAPLLSHCARSCIRHNGCNSLIYKKNPSTTSEHNCQLLNVEKSSLVNDDTEHSIGWIYYYPLQQVNKSTYREIHI